MCPRVLVQNSLLPKVLPTLSTLVRFFTSMDSQMLIENSPLSEISSAIDAPVRFFVGMNPQMLGEMRLLSEPFPAFWTRVRPGFDMYATVLEQRRLLLKLLLTNGATHVQRHSRRPAVLDHIRQTLQGKKR